MIALLYRKITHHHRLAKVARELDWCEQERDYWIEEAARVHTKFRLVEQERNEIRFPLPRVLRDRVGT